MSYLAKVPVLIARLELSEPRDGRGVSGDENGLGPEGEVPEHVEEGNHATPQGGHLCC